VGRAVIYMLDTNICIYIINKRPPQVRAHFEGLRYGQVVVSSITGAELAFGFAKSGSARNREALEKFLAPLEVLSFDSQAMYAYGALRAQLQANGQPIGALDTLIAAHALVVGATLVTNNLAEFARVPGLACENWV
jgi:tRNA(fMet)-specific endonuclease VapC